MINKGWSFSARDGTSLLFWMYVYLYLFVLLSVYAIIYNHSTHCMISIRCASCDWEQQHCQLSGARAWLTCNGKRMVPHSARHRHWNNVDKETGRDDHDSQSDTSASRG